MGRGEGLLEGVEKVQLWGKRGSVFFEIGFFEDGTNIEQSEQSSSAVHLFKDVDRAGSNT